VLLRVSQEVSHESCAYKVLGSISMGTGGHDMPVADVLVKVEVLTPLNQVVHFLIEVLIIQHHELLVIEGVFVHFLQGRDLLLLFHGLLPYELRILRVLIQLPQPFDFLVSLLLGRELLALLLAEVELGGFVGGSHLHRVVRCQDLVTDWSPPIVFIALIPSIEPIILIFIIFDVDLGLLLLLLDLHVVSGRKGVDIDDGPMRKYLIVDQRREFISTQSEPNVAPRSPIEHGCLSRVHTLQ